MLTWDDISEDPTYRRKWDGNLITNDGTRTDDFTREDVAEILLYGDTGGDWDGTGAGVLRLKDGRFVSWESIWGPTGSGFCADAYGGDADINFSSTLEKAIEHISEKSRELLKSEPSDGGGWYRSSLDAHEPAVPVDPTDPHAELRAVAARWAAGPTFTLGAQDAQILARGTLDLLRELETARQETRMAENAAREAGRSADRAREERDRAIKERDEARAERDQAREAIAYILPRTREILGATTGPYENAHEAAARVVKERDVARTERDAARILLENIRRAVRNAEGF